MVAEIPQSRRGPGRRPLPPESRRQRRVAMLPPEDCTKLEQLSVLLGVSESECLLRGLHRELRHNGLLNHSA